MQPFKSKLAAAFAGGAVVFCMIVAIGIAFGAATATNMLIVHPDAAALTCPTGEACIVAGDGGILQGQNVGQAFAPITLGLDAVAPMTITVGPVPQITITAATGAAAGSMSAADFAKLAAMGADAAVNSVTASSPITSSGGGTPNIACNVADGGNAGCLAAADFATFSNKVTSVSGTSPVVSSGGLTPAISIPSYPVVDAGTPGQFLTTDGGIAYWSAGNSGTVTSVAGSSPITSTGGATPTIACNVADGGQAGCLSTTDWLTFNAKVPTSTTISTTAPLTGGGDLSANRTIAIPTYPVVSAGTPGQFLTTDGGIAYWSTGNAGTVTNVTASSPITSSGGTTPNVACNVADGGNAGCIAAADFVTFNNKVDSVSGTLPIVSSGGKTPAISIQGYPVVDAGTAGQILTTDGGLSAYWATAAATGVTSVTGTLPVVSSGGTTPAISLQGYPVTDAGTAGQVLTTDGGLSAYWATAASGAAASRLILSGAGGWSVITSGSSGPNKSELATNKIDLQTQDYSDSNSKLFTQWTTLMPSNWDASTVTMKVVWTANSTSTNSAVFGCQCRGYANGDTIDQAFGTAQEVSQANTSTANQMHVSNATSAITCGGTPAASFPVQWQCYRDSSNGSDTLAATVNVMMFVISLTTT